MNLKESFNNNEPDYASWIRVFRPPANVPDWIKATIVLDLGMMKDLMKEIESKASDDKKVRVSLKESKGKKLYTVYDTYYRDKVISSSDHSPDRDEEDDLPI